MFGSSFKTLAVILFRIIIVFLKVVIFERWERLLSAYLGYQLNVMLILFGEKQIPCFFQLAVSP